MLSQELFLESAAISDFNLKVDQIALFLKRRSFGTLISARFRAVLL